MRKKILTIALLSIGLLTFGQSRSEIARVYIKRAQELAEKIEFKEANVQFEKAMKYTDTINTSDLAWLGAYIKFELKEYEAAKSYAKKYFLVKRNKKSEEYMSLLETYVTIEEKLTEIEEEKKRLELERLRKEKEQRRLDSLEVVWKKKAASLSLQLDELEAFNRFGTAIYKKGNYFGIIKDNGQVIVDANKYQGLRSFDGYTLLMDKAENPSRIFAFDHSTLQGHIVPRANSMNNISTSFQEVTLPRGNGKVALYPNNSLQVVIYDIPARAVTPVGDFKEVFKQLKKTDKIAKSNKDGQVKLNKQWYYFGGDLGAGVHPLFEEDHSIIGYLLSISGAVLPASSHNHIGVYYDGSYQYFINGTVSWMDQSGVNVEAGEYSFGIYNGPIEVTKTEDGTFRFMRNGKIILADEEIDLLDEFLKKN